ncbi:DNA polymerase III subunit gamma/tau [Cardinium endosymbiont of Tipula unca]|uniref:DNA polymerase III subunit gamma/tau n=1 Tax=Cardinium endosymbiont of Tipula unca TaxID=3066216 RepID=UPI0030CA743C
MTEFVVSARKYRPTSFRDVISQSHITTTLKNAIAHKQLAHSFLFCGPRGVGKTTCARILAKAINCLQVTDGSEPCNHCTNCLSFSNNSSMNVYELDAASNNSVEDIRDLVDQVRYAPQMGRYKIYIIDEVHMLSNAAFNAFLKTLEEPPSYAIFILATTERHKVLPTILSRCQIFNFNRIKLEDIVAQLQAIALQESIPYEASALQLIAQKAEGAMRDALSMFDLIATSARTAEMITYAMARDHLQLLDHDYYFKCTEAFLEGDIPALLSLYDTILRVGFNGHHFVVGLGEHLRNLMVCKNSATIPLLEVTDNLRPQYAEHASRCTMAFLLRALALLNQCDISYKSSQHQRLHVELLLIELASIHLLDTENEANKTIPKILQTDKSKKEKQLVEKSRESQAPLVEPPSIATTTKPVATSMTPPSQVVGDAPPRQRETIAIPKLETLKSLLTSEQKASAPSQKKKIVTKPGKEQPIVGKEVVQSFFADYREKLKKDGNMAGYHLMNQPIEIQDNMVTIALINPVQEAILQNLKEQLVVQLRKQINHASITIQGCLVQQEQEKKPYTDQEKLTYLGKKNVNIDLLRERFVLEVAY